MSGPEWCFRSGREPNAALVLLCTYNERATLPEAVRRIHEAIPKADILVVDDNSPDGTGGWLEAETENDRQLFAFHRSGKLGLGSAIMVGVRWAQERRYTWLINLDADLSHDPADIPKLLALAMGPPSFDVAVASRYVSGGAIVGWPWRRKFISRWLNRVARWTLNLPIKDCSGSFRCYRVSKFSELPLGKLTSKGYALLEELLYMFAQHDASFVETPITFTDRKLGQSKLNGTEAWQTAVTLFRLAVNGR
jgi:dolichol-phosphate mannosyltransferase